MKKLKRVEPIGRAYVVAGFNNTHVTVTRPNGEIVAWATSGSSGFKGARKSTPFAASVAAAEAAKKALNLGVREVSVFVKGPGSGRDSAIKSLKAGGLEISSISDVTPIPHNGCRPKKRRRV